MKIKNYEIETFHKYLFELNLFGKKSRMRTRFVRLLETYWDNFMKLDRHNIIDAYSMRDEHNELLMNEEKTEVILQPDKIEIFRAEMEELLNEEFIIEENEVHREMLLIVAEVMFESDTKLSGQDAIMYDRWCEEFEKIIEHYALKEEHNQS